MTNLSSMTGFGSASGEADWGSWSIEAKSVNGRGLDVRVNYPPGFEALDRAAKAAASARFNRGNLQLAVRVEPALSAGGSTINFPLLQTLMETVQRSSDGTGLSAEAMAQLLQVRGVVEAGTPDLRALAGDDTIVGALQAGLEQALDSLAAARADEGRDQDALLHRLIAEMREAAERAQTAAATQPGLLRQRLETQLAAIDAADKVDADRLAVEIALSVAKADVREELDRLAAHFIEANKLLEGGSPVGRKLDFLSQEIGRESNTLCSKSASLDLTNAGLALKALNDQFKEQAANVE